MFDDTMEYNIRRDPTLYIKKRYRQDLMHDQVIRIPRGIYSPTSTVAVKSKLLKKTGRKEFGQIAAIALNCSRNCCRIAILGYVAQHML